MTSYIKVGGKWQKVPKGAVVHVSKGGKVSFERGGRVYSPSRPSSSSRTSRSSSRRSRGGGGGIKIYSAVKGRYVSEEEFKKSNPWYKGIESLPKGTKIQKGGKTYVKTTLGTYQKKSLTSITAPKRTQEIQGSTIMKSEPKQVSVSSRIREIEKKPSIWSLIKKTNPIYIESQLTKKYLIPDYLKYMEKKGYSPSDNLKEKSFLERMKYGWEVTLYTLGYPFNYLSRQFSKGARVIYAATTPFSKESFLERTQTLEERQESLSKEFEKSIKGKQKQLQSELNKEIQQKKREYELLLRIKYPKAPFGLPLSEKELKKYKSDYEYYSSQLSKDIGSLYYQKQKELSSFTESEKRRLEEKYLGKEYGKGRLGVRSEVAKETVLNLLNVPGGFEFAIELGAKPEKKVPEIIKYTLERPAESAIVFGLPLLTWSYIGKKGGGKITEIGIKEKDIIGAERTSGVQLKDVFVGKKEGSTAIALKSGKYELFAPLKTKEFFVGKEKVSTGADYLVGEYLIKKGKKNVEKGEVSGISFNLMAEGNKKIRGINYGAQKIKEIGKKHPKVTYTSYLSLEKVGEISKRLQLRDVWDVSKFFTEKDVYGKSTSLREGLLGIKSKEFIEKTRERGIEIIRSKKKTENLFTFEGGTLFENVNKFFEEGRIDYLNKIKKIVKEKGRGKIKKKKESYSYFPREKYKGKEGNLLLELEKGLKERKQIIKVRKKGKSEQVLITKKRLREIFKEYIRKEREKTGLKVGAVLGLGIGGKIRIGNILKGSQALKIEMANLEKAGLKLKELSITKPFIETQEISIQQPEITPTKILTPPTIKIVPQKITIPPPPLMFKPSGSFGIFAYRGKIKATRSYEYSPTLTGSFLPKISRPPRIKKFSGLEVRPFIKLKRTLLSPAITPKLNI